MKKLAFIGDSLNGLRSFPADTKQQAGYQLHKVQSGEMPTDFKTMPTIGSGVIEIRLKDQIGIYRVIYTAKIADPCMCFTHSKRKPKKPPKAI